MTDIYQQSSRESVDWVEFAGSVERVAVLDAYAGKCLLVGLTRSTEPMHLYAAIGILHNVLGGDFKDDPEVLETARTLERTYEEDPNRDPLLAEAYEMEIGSILPERARKYPNRRKDSTTEKKKHKYKEVVT